MSEDFDPQELILYEGPSLALSSPPESGIALVAYLNRDSAARVVDRILSARGVPFFIERSRGQWTGTPSRLVIVVQPGRQQEAEALLDAATDARLLERVPGAEGLDHY